MIIKTAAVEVKLKRVAKGDISGDGSIPGFIEAGQAGGTEFMEKNRERKNKQKQQQKKVNREFSEHIRIIYWIGGKMKVCGRVFFPDG